jgi:hypothetical protein
LALETVCLIDSIGKFFYRAITDTTNTDGGNETNILNGDMLIAILRNNISAGMERWKKYVVGQDYRKYVQAYVKAHSKNPEFHYAHYPHVSKASFKEYFAEIPYDTVVDYGNLLTHPYWNYILRKARFDQKTFEDITKGAWTQN